MIKKEQKKISLEDINDSLKGIDGRFGDIDKHFEKIDERFDGIDKRFDSLDKKVDILTTRVDNLDRSYRYIGLQMEKLETKFDLALEGYNSLKELGEKMNERLNVLEGHGSV